MAEAQTAEPAVDGDQPAKSGGSLTSKLLIVGFMVGVVAIECAIAYFLIPSADEVAQMAERKMADRLPETMGDDRDADKDANPTVELDLGEYTVTVTQPNSNTALRVDFKLVGTVAEGDEREATGLFDRNVHRFRDQILYEVRNSEPADLADPALGLIKRRFLDKSSAVFGKPIFREILIPQFSYVEQ